MKELQLKHLSPYLPYKIRLHYGYGDKIGFISNIYTIGDGYDNDDIKISIDNGDGEHIWMFRPILRPLSDLTKAIKFNLTTYAFTDLFEIGDTDGCIFEFDHGNIKTIKAIESIAEHYSCHDISYLPSAVVQMMTEHLFDIFGLIPAGLAININTLDENYDSI